MSAKQWRISDSDQTPESAVIHERLKAHIEKESGPPNRRPLVISVEDERGKLVAGLRGFTHWQWLYVSHVWVEESQRSSGLGTELLARAENEAKSRNCVGIYVDTFSEKTRDYYLARGYQEFGALADFPPGQKRSFLYRRL